jgi:hypothetical protein
MIEKEQFYIVRVKRPLKAVTFKLFKNLTPAIRYMQRELRSRGITAQFKGFSWEETRSTDSAPLRALANTKE